jgi:multiple sugar transport system permease protein
MGGMKMAKTSGAKKKRKGVSYEKYGYFFILPFFLVYFIFQLYPLLNTFYWSLFTYQKRNLKETIEFSGLLNFQKILGLIPGESANFLLYLKNTIVMWMGGFIPQILLSLLLAAWLTNEQVKIRGRGGIKILTYMPNIITAASVSVLFASLFAQYGPITMTLKKIGVLASDYNFFDHVGATRGLISFILFWMWYGNTTLILIAGMMGINPSLYEAAEIDGANGGQTFFKITLPLLKPILLYTLVTSAVGGLQMYDIPSLFNVSGSSMSGGPNDSTTTVTMYIMRLYNSDVGRAAAVSVLLFIITLIVSICLFISMGDKDEKLAEKQKKLAEKEYKRQQKALKGGN